MLSTLDPQARHGLAEFGGGGLEAGGASDRGAGGLFHPAGLVAHLIQVAGDLFSYRALLFAGGGDLGAHLQHGVAVVAQLVDVLPHFCDELLAAGGAPDRLLHDVVERPCAGLQLFNHLLDLHRGLLGAAGEGTHLVCHHGKAAALLAGPGGLDGGVERQQVGLLGDGVDDVDHFVDAVGIVGQPLDGA